MKKILVMFLTLSLITGMAFIVGCSDDDDEGNGVVIKPDGDLNDPLYLAVMDPIGEVENTVPQGLEVMLEYLNVLDSMANKCGKAIDLKVLGVSEPDTVWYDEVTKYWHGMGESEEMSWHSFSRDSVQFMHGAVAVQWPDTTLLTRINCGCHHYETMTMELAVDTVFDYSFRGSIVGEPGEIYANGDITANGSGSIFDNNMIKSGDDLYCEYQSLDDDFTVSNVQMIIWQLMESGCPYAGSVTHNLDIDMYCSGDSSFNFTSSWYVQESFSNDSSHYVIENDLYRWEYSEECRIFTKP